MHHHIFSLTFDGALLRVPIPEGKVLHHVLDIGTGTGIWASEWIFLSVLVLPLDTNFRSRFRR